MRTVAQNPNLRPPNMKQLEKKGSSGTKREEALLRGRLGGEMSTRTGTTTATKGLAKQFHGKRDNRS